ncbi:MAG: AAA family ATPase [Nanoarchaeota archaeon]|nr:AAA family ATPase [Nanoarchaeota archaeon]
MKKYILTGGPCTGKTTLLEKIAKEGFNTIDEVAREIILEEENKEKSTLGYKGILPWNSIEKFHDLVIHRQLDEEKRVYTSAFLDRSLVDNVAYMSLGKVRNDGHIYQCIEQAGYGKVFFLEQLPHYAKDEARKESPEEAKKIHRRLYEVYHDLGFEMINVPPIGVEQRAKFILEYLK